jgi:hypothetical protein
MVSLVMWILIKQAWPAHLEEEAERHPFASHLNPDSQNHQPPTPASKPGAEPFSGTFQSEEDEGR